MAEHDLLPRSLKPDSGGVVVETRDGVILRVVRHARAAEGHASDGDALLPVLDPRLPLAAPQTERLARRIRTGERVV